MMRAARSTGRPRGRRSGFLGWGPLPGLDVAVDQVEAFGAGVAGFARYRAGALFELLRREEIEAHGFAEVFVDVVGAVVGDRGFGFGFAAFGRGVFPVGEVFQVVVDPVVEQTVGEFVGDDAFDLPDAVALEVGGEAVREE
jgi:hypothetical protein